LSILRNLNESGVPKSLISYDQSIPERSIVADTT